MKILDIRTSRPQLDINTTSAKLNISQKTRQFDMKSSKTQMSTTVERPEMHVNWEKVWNESGRKSPDAWRQHMNQQSRQDVEQAIQKFVSDGNYVLQVEDYKGSDSDPFAQIALQRMESEIPEINVASMPESLAEVSWTPGSIDIDWSIGGVQADWNNEFEPEINITPHSVEINLSGRPEVKISVKESSGMDFGL